LQTSSVIAVARVVDRFSQTDKAWKRLGKEFKMDGIGDDLPEFLRELEKIGTGKAFAGDKSTAGVAASKANDDDDDDDLSSVDTYDSEYGEDWKKAAREAAGDKAFPMDEGDDESEEAEEDQEDEGEEEEEEEEEEEAGERSGAKRMAARVRDIYGQDVPAARALDDADGSDESSDSSDESEEEFEQEREDGSEDAAAGAAVAAASSATAGGRYVTPAMRRRMQEEASGAAAAAPAAAPSHAAPASADVDEEDEEEITARRALSRRVRGLLNRLGEGNLEPVSKQMVELFRTNSTGRSARVLADEIVGACATATGVVKSVLSASAGLVGALHVLVGLSAGAAVLERVVRRIQEQASLPAVEDAAGAGDADEEVGSLGLRDAAQRSLELGNLATVLSYLHLFNVAHHDLVFQALRRMLHRLSDWDVEMLLAIVRICGFQLRGDDPAALRDVVAAATSAAGTGEGVSARASVMLGLLSDVKNNRRRQTDEQLRDRGAQTRKWLAAVAKRAGKEGVDRRIRAGWDDLCQADSKGRWWLVGASWAGHGAVEAGAGGSTLAPAAAMAKPAASAASASAADLVLYEAAGRHGFASDVRRRVFAAMMGADGVDDAVERIGRLGLRGPTEREAVRVLLECAAKSKRYNPFFSALGTRLCETQPKNKFTFQLALWDSFKTLETATNRRVFNLAKLTAELLLRFVLSLAVLKAFDVTRPTERTVLFMRVCIGSVLETAADDDRIVAVFTRLGAAADKALVRDTLSLFLSKYMPAHITALCGGEGRADRDRRKELKRRLRLASRVIGAKPAT
jgi:nucleolar MIF4G domain-containing protein 1